MMDPVGHGAAREGPGLGRYLSPIGAWALSFGCAVGWGAFVMPGTTFLPMAGPLGTSLGILIGAGIMLAIGANYHDLMVRWPDDGGTFTFSKRVLGYDHGFLSAWYLVLVYVAITWANATALPLVFRNLAPGLFQWGLHYTVAGYDVYLGEALLELAVLESLGILSIQGSKIAAWIQILMAEVLLGGILIGGASMVLRHGGDLSWSVPAFVPAGGSPASQVFRMVALAPWAFVGFESISHSTRGFRFPVERTFSVFAAAVATSALAYITLTALSVSVLPEGYADWPAYIADIGRLDGLQGLPVFYAVREMMGKPGLAVLCVTLLGAVVTGLVGNSVAASRLIWSMAEDDLLPAWFRGTNGDRAPRNAILFLMAVSVPIPFFGRTAIGWIVDVNTIGATIAYAYTSVAAFKVAREEGRIRSQVTGLIGIVSSVLFFVYFLVPNLWSVSALSTESYLILIVWSVLGFLFFRYLLFRDRERRFGQSTAVWIVILFLLFFTSTLWVREATKDTLSEVIDDLEAYNIEEMEEHGVGLTDTERGEAEDHIQDQLDLVDRSMARNTFFQMILVMAILFLMFSIYDLMSRREQEMELQKAEAEQNSRAKSTFLSNMSHDIRTPMNAIVGYTALSKKEPGIPPKVSEYLTKIEASSEHLLSLINDVLEMSRIESGKMELEPVPADLGKVMDEVRDLFATQMETKGIDYTVSVEGVTDRRVLCDTGRLDRVLLNLISNAYKFTPSGGSVRVSLTQTGRTEESASFELRVKDSGMGMSKEFAATVFDAYSRERTASKIQGTGLGMSIARSIVELMGGTIRVETEQGKGTEFTIEVTFPLAGDDGEDGASEGGGAGEVRLEGVRLLLVEDNEINREIATLLLEEAGMELDTAENGKIAVEKVAASRPGDYQLVLMDIQMPVMDGYEATKAIRALKDQALARIPIVAMTANAFSEDIQAARDAGMDGHIAKPIDVPKMMETLAEILR